MESCGYNVEYRMKNSMNVIYSIANMSESDAGEYSCVVEGEGGSVQNDRTLVASEEIQATFSLTWWNQTQVG